MQSEEVYAWAGGNPHRRLILLQADQPLTVKQTARRTSLALRACSEALAQLSNRRLVRCLNRDASRSRVYWLTRDGVWCQKRLRTTHFLRPFTHDFPVVDWRTYGDVCHTHRSAVIAALDSPMRPPAIRRRARSRNDRLRMSTNNVREVLRVLRGMDVVEAVRVARDPYPWYQLTQLGQRMRRLLQRAECITPECSKILGLADAPVPTGGRL